jgi:hypothetical protein
MQEERIKLYAAYEALERLRKGMPSVGWQDMDGWDFVTSCENYPDSTLGMVVNNAARYYFSYGTNCDNAKLFMRDVPDLMERLRLMAISLSTVVNRRLQPGDAVLASALAYEMLIAIHNELDQKHAFKGISQSVLLLDEGSSYTSLVYLVNGWLQESYTRCARMFRRTTLKFKSVHDWKNVRVWHSSMPGVPGNAKVYLNPAYYYTSGTEGVDFENVPGQDVRLHYEDD